MNKSFAIASVSLELLQASSDHRAMDSSASEKDQEIADKTKQLEDGTLCFGRDWGSYLGH